MQRDEKYIDNQLQGDAGATPYLVVTSHQFPLWVKDDIGIVLIATIAGAAGITGVTRLLVPHVCNHIDGVIPGHAAESFLHG